MSKAELLPKSNLEKPIETFSEMRQAYNLILFGSPTLPEIGSSCMQEAYESLIARDLSPDTAVRFGAGCAFYDKQSGIEVGDRSRNAGFAGGNRLHSNIRMRAIPADGKSKLEAAMSWVSGFIGQDAADALQEEYASQNQRTDSTGELGFDVRTDADDTEGLKMTIGLADLTNYGDDTGIKGKTFNLTPEQARQIGEIFGRQLGKMKRVDQLDLEELTAGTVQVFSQSYKEALIEQELAQLVKDIKSRGDVILTGDDRVEFTRQWIENRAKELASYQPERFEYSVNDRVFRKMPHGPKYSRDPKKAALLLAREQAKHIQAEALGGPLDVAAMDRKDGIEHAVRYDDELRAISEKAQRVIADAGELAVGEVDSFGYKKTTYEPGLKKEATDYESIDGVKHHDRATNNHYFVDESGQVVRERRTPNQSWPGGVRSIVVDAHTFSEKNTQIAASLVRKLADKQGVSNAKSVWADNDRASNVGTAKRKLEEVNVKRRKMAEEARNLSQAEQE